MKHVDQTSLKAGGSNAPEGETEGADGVDFALIGAGLEHAESRALAQALVDGLSLGVVLWSPEGRCELAGASVAPLMELEGCGLKRGDHRESFLQCAVDRGAFTAEQKESAVARFAAKEPFSYTRTSPKGRVVLTKINPRPDGGHVVTMSDITDFVRTEQSLSADKARAEKMERKLGTELARLTREKADFEGRQKELQRLSLVAAHAKDLIVISDATHRIVWANEAFRRHNGLDLEMDLIGKSGRDVLTGPKTNRDALAQVDEAVRNRQALTLEMVCHKRSGEDYWMEQEILPVFDDNGAHTNFILVGRDITERKLAEAAAANARRFEEMKRAESLMLAEFNEWLQSSDTLDELFVVVSSFLEKLLPGSSGGVYTYTAARDSLQKACGWGEGRMIEYFDAPDCWALRRGRPYFFGGNTIDISCDHVKAAGAETAPGRQFCLPIIAHGDTVGLLSVAFDGEAGADTQKLVNFCAEHISLAIANVKMRELLREQSNRDPLTGLYNRRFFLDYAKRELKRCAGADRPASMISLDVDHFKQFNDTYGHETGDAVLEGLSAVLTKIFRQADVPCRIGGEEFVVMMPGCEGPQALERAEQLRDAVSRMQLRHGGEDLKVTISAGVATLDANGETVPEILQAADQALYAAKAAGRNCVKPAR